MNKSIKFAAAGGASLIGLGILLWYAQPKDFDPHAAHQPKSTSRALAADTDNYDFGTISMKNGVVEKTFAVRNTTAAPVTISKLYTSCMCTNASIEIGGKKKGPFGMQGHGVVPPVDEVLSPNETANVSVVFDPNAHGPSGIGVIERVVTLEDPDGAALALNIKANVIP